MEYIIRYLCKACKYVWKSKQEFTYCPKCLSRDLETTKELLQ